MTAEELSQHMPSLACPEKPSTKRHDNVRPLFDLRRDYYLIPVLIWGPNNQMNGLIETIALAIKLDRTLVLPKFYRHYRDPLALDVNADNFTRFYQDSIDPEFRISVKSLKELLPVVFIDELQTVFIYSNNFGQKLNIHCWGCFSRKSKYHSLKCSLFWHSSRRIKTPCRKIEIFRLFLK